MLRIGEFSKLSRVSIRMLSHYDDIGLLKPAEIDQFTGYRYYSPEQLPVIGRITALKDLTWTLDGRMMVCLTASNDLSNVDIVVNPKARLLLQAGVSDRAYTPFLNAKSLTLKGGDTETSIPMLTLAKTNPTSKFSTSAYAPATFDDATFSPKVFLNTVSMDSRLPLVTIGSLPA